MAHAIEPTLLVSANTAARGLGLLLAQSLKLQARLALAIGALTASECILLLCLLVFPLELVFVNGLPFLRRLGVSPSHRLAEWGLFFLESAPRVIAGATQPARGPGPNPTD